MGFINDADRQHRAEFQRQQARHSASAQARSDAAFAALRAELADKVDARARLAFQHSGKIDRVGVTLEERGEDGPISQLWVRGNDHTRSLFVSLAAEVLQVTPDRIQIDRYGLLTTEQEGSGYIFGYHLNFDFRVVPHLE